ncbi:pyridoxamine 5'-phosphate oxidase family protein [Catenulispora subtropica]|uniref:PPOX class F420-dependent oxidoreductase n=1 Tax=Catenulispora subtropica TaxID=450798 RepID=A0ABP5ENR3_9ACTN
MSQRDRIRMSDDEIESFLASARKLQVASINPDGTPHLVTMYYAVMDGDLAFWTYGKAQKTVNLRRDPRITCLVEDGVAYNELRGVTVYGEAELIEDHDDVVAFGMALTARYPEVFGADAEAMRPFVEQQAPKRTVVRVHPKRTASWDHSKM